MEERLEDRIYTYSTYLLRKFHRKVFRVGLSTGIKCPHRMRTGGCIFCAPETFTGEYLSCNLSVKDQLEQGISLVTRSCGEVGILAYFQEDTSTAGDVLYLKQKFADAVNHEKVLGLVISTRPDYIDENMVTMLAGIERPVTIEIGMQSIHDKSLVLLNRGHDFARVEQAVQLCGEKGLTVGVHLIMGIPGEDHRDMLATIRYISANPYIHQVKFHNLVVYRDTMLHRLYLEKKMELLSMEAYITELAELLPYLRGDIVITRLFTSSIRRAGIAIPEFQGVKTRWMNSLRKYIYKKGILQGTETAVTFDPHNNEIVK